MDKLRTLLHHDRNKETFAIGCPLEGEQLGPTLDINQARAIRYRS